MLCSRRTTNNCDNDDDDDDATFSYNVRIEMFEQKQKRRL